MTRLIYNVVLLLVVLTACYAVWRLGNTEPLTPSSAASSTKYTAMTVAAKTTKP
jgi:hypothetical protein